jgi:co-chaperonin GroES (HSP10)
MSVTDSHADMTFTHKLGVKPMPGWVLLERCEPPAMTEHGIHLITKDASEQRFELARATVLRIGDPKQDDKGQRHPSAFTPGQTVMVGRFVGHDAKFSDGTGLFVQEHEVLGIVD